MAKRNATTKIEVPAQGKFKTYNRQNRDWDMWLDGEYIGSRSTPMDADVALDQAQYDRLTH